MEKRENKRRIGWRIIQVLGVIVFIVCDIYMASVLYKKYMEQQKYEALKETVTLEDVENAEFDGEREGDAPNLPKGFENGGRTSIDFDALQLYNSELVAWIEIPDTNIDYPVARHEGEDQDYYLNHNMYKEPAFSGCIYMEDTNEADFSDSNTILYGHNMKNGTMFKNLHEFEDSSFFKEHTEVYVYIPGHKLTYEIFAAYTTDAVKLTAAWDFTKQEDYERYIESLKEIRSMGAMVRENVTLTGEDKILTLSTCVGGQTEKRYLVQGVLTDDMETE